MSTVNLGEGVGLVLERGTFYFHPLRSDPALISYFRLRSITGQEAERALHSALPDERLSQNRSSPEVLAPILQILIFHDDLIYAVHLCRHWYNTTPAFPSIRLSLDTHCRTHINLVGASMDLYGDTPLEASPHPHPGGNAGTCYPIHPIASPEFVLAL